VEKPGVDAWMSLMPRPVVTASLVAVVSVLGALATGRLSFIWSAAVSASLALYTLATALRSGRAAVAAGDASRAGAIAGGMLALRLVGTASLMVTASFVPALLDLWGVLAGMVAVDVMVIAGEGLEAIASLSSDPEAGFTGASRRGV
jgi:hypothetical protein